MEIALEGIFVLKERKAPRLPLLLRAISAQSVTFVQHKPMFLAPAHLASSNPTSARRSVNHALQDFTVPSSA